MKTYCKKTVIDTDFVSQALAAWKCSRAGHKNKWRINTEHGSETALVREIVREVSDRSIALRPIRRYTHIEKTNGKTRVIGVESVKQQVLDYVAVSALEEFLNNRSGYYQVSSVRGKGQLFAARTVRRWVQEGGYWVHLDIRQCYPSISHQSVLSILSRYIKNDDVLYICSALLQTYDLGGLEIGSYFSLRMAQLVLSFAYRHVESLGKTRRGKRASLVNHQIWYMDDGYLFSRDKRNLRMAARSLSNYLRSEFGLTVKPWKICAVSDDEPVDIAGYVVRRTRVTIRSNIFLRGRRALDKFNNVPSITNARRVCSYWGWFVNSDSTGFIARNDARRIKNRACSVISKASKRLD